MDTDQCRIPGKVCSTSIVPSCATRWRRVHCTDTSDWRLAPKHRPDGFISITRLMPIPCPVCEPPSGIRATRKRCSCPQLGQEPLCTMVVRGTRRMKGRQRRGIRNGDSRRGTPSAPPETHPQATRAEDSIGQRSAGGSSEASGCIFRDRTKSRMRQRGAQSAGSPRVRLPASPTGLG